MAAETSTDAAGAWEVVDLSDDGSDVDLCEDGGRRPRVSSVTPNALRNVKNAVTDLQTSLDATSKELQHTQESVGRLTKRVAGAERASTSGVRAILSEEFQVVEDRLERVRKADMRQVSDMEDLLFQINDRVDKEHKDRNKHDEQVSSISEGLAKTQTTVDELRGSVDGHGLSLDENQKAIEGHKKNLSDQRVLFGVLADTANDIVVQVKSLSGDHARQQEGLYKVKAELRSEVERLDAQLRSLKTSLVLATQEHAKKEEELEAKTKEQLTSTVLADLDSRAANCTDQLKGMQSVVDHHGRQLGDLTDDLRFKLSFKASKNDLSAARDEVNAMKRTLSDLNMRVTSQIDTLKCFLTRASLQGQVQLQQQQTQTATSATTQTLSDAHKTTQTKQIQRQTQTEGQIDGSEAKVCEDTRRAIEPGNDGCASCDKLSTTVEWLERSLVREIQANVVRERTDRGEKLEMRAEMSELRNILEVLTLRMDEDCTQKDVEQQSQHLTVSVNTQTDILKRRDAQTQKNSAELAAASAADQIDSLMIPPSMCPPPPPPKSTSIEAKSADVVAAVSLLTLSPMMSINVLPTSATSAPVVATSTKPSVVSVSSRLLQTLNTSATESVDVEHKSTCVDDELSMGYGKVKKCKQKRLRRSRRSYRKMKRARPSSAGGPDANDGVSVGTNTPSKTHRASFTQTQTTRGAHFSPLPSSPEEADALPSPPVVHHTDVLVKDDADGRLGLVISCSPPQIKSVTGVRASQRPLKFNPCPRVRPRNSAKSKKNRNSSSSARVRTRSQRFVTNGGSSSSMNYHQRRNHTHQHEHRPSPILNDWSIEAPDFFARASASRTERDWQRFCAAHEDQFTPLIARTDPNTESALIPSFDDDGHETTVYQLGGRSMNAVGSNGAASTDAAGDFLSALVATNAEVRHQRGSNTTSDLPPLEDLFGSAGKEPTDLLSSLPTATSAALAGTSSREYYDTLQQKYWTLMEVMDNEKN